MRRYLLAAAAIVFSALGLSSASALVEGKRVALVIGNSAYVHAVTLPNPINDGKLMAETFRKAGFSVIEGEDLNKIDMGRLLDQFTEAAYDADIAVVYYAGHGLQVDQRNYLIPVDAELQNTAQLQTRTIPVDDVLNALPPDPAIGIVILDACRDNPLARTLAAALPKSRSMGAGLAAVQAAGRTHDSGGLLIAYATDPEAVAYDGKGANSPYTTALARHLTTPGLEIQSALTRVRADVSQATNGAQHPWANASLGREVFLGAPPPDTRSNPQAATGAPQSAVNGSEVDWTVEQKLWDEASKRNTIAHYDLYLSQYPNGRFASVARLNIDQLKQAGANQTASAGPTGAGAAAVSSQTEASQIRTGVAIPDDVKQTPGTPETEAQIKLGKEERIDLQLRLSALGHSTGGFDGSLGPRTRSAIGEWQRDSGIAETTYLTPQQHMLLVVQTDPLMAGVRAQYETQKAAAESRKQASKAASAAKVTQKTANTARKKNSQQTAEDDIPYRPRGTGAPVDNGGSEVGSFAAGALLGTALGVAIGKH
ncbi:caspase family protein [Mesorhizobium sp. BAC0120]|uniref:caspase family protein n=1 Tax=Mesorhizobium sp. BAC0120 TaxID=3090670 RepID=UPI00298C10E1|nr:caspase family protein [Mesorhizobium sp. BAC0120]MDW6026078.1 caspase family protein [Mesorhizobium sp. BAC0120]